MTRRAGPAGSNRPATAVALRVSLISRDAPDYTKRYSGGQVALMGAERGEVMRSQWVQLSAVKPANADEIKRTPMLITSAA